MPPIEAKEIAGPVLLMKANCIANLDINGSLFRLISSLRQAPRGCPPFEVLVPCADYAD